jgi:hypothetical protein
MKAEKNEVRYSLIEVKRSKDVLIFEGTKKECNAKKKELNGKYNNNEMYITIDRYEVITK